jgi:dihydropteroate synthase
VSEFEHRAALPRGPFASGGPPRIYLRPLDPPERRIEVLLRQPGRVIVATTTVDRLEDWAVAEGEAVRVRVRALVDRIAAPRPPFAGLALDRPRIMGIVNVTPDSFSDGGRFAAPEAAIAHGLALREAGADILDVGGESTRPGAAPVSVDDELKRVVPVVAGLKGCGVPLSIDTRRAAVMAAALDVGAGIVNDVSALTHDPDALALVARRRVPVILMHMRGEPATMQVDPRYDCAPLDVFDYLEARVAACTAAGIATANIAVDPGIGFGKSVAHNLEILGRLSLFRGLGVPILLGVSRKGFIGRLSRAESADRRLPGSLAAALAGVTQGVQILRVHDVAETAQALAVWRAIRASS